MVDDWRDNLTFGCLLCGDSSTLGFQHSYECAGWFGLIDGPGHLMLFWYLIQEIENDHRAMMRAIEEEAK